jgi:nitrogen fixation protein
LGINDFLGMKQVGVEAIDDSMLVTWLRDSGRKAAFPKAIRAIFATRGGELMLDRPKGIYQKDLPSTTISTGEGDIWGGSILLSHRVDLLTLVQSSTIMVIVVVNV